MRSIRPLFLSTYPPEECGLATFTRDTADAVNLAANSLCSSVMAIRKLAPLSSDDSRVVHLVNNADPTAYRDAATFVNRSSHDVVSLQHEFGLYPDDWGRRILDFTRACVKPIVTTFHTLPTQPTALPRQLIRELAMESREVIVMTHTAARLLSEVYGVKGTSVNVIPHGVPTSPFAKQEHLKSELGLEGRQVICTFGLINRGKGLEHMLRAMPKVVSECPNALYLIIGATHPQVKLHEGEGYREELIELARSLGVAEHVRFVNRYLDQSELLKYLGASDVFVTPYPGKDQIASGTMAYAMATVGAVISTPYLYATEVLGDGRGVLVPFDNSRALAAATVHLLTNPQLLAALRQRAYQYVRPMFWPNVGRLYLDVFRGAATPERRNAAGSVRLPTVPRSETLVKEIQRSL